MTSSVFDFSERLRKKFDFDSRISYSHLEFLEIPKRSFTIWVGYTLALMSATHASQFPLDFTNLVSLFNAYFSSSQNFFLHLLRNQFNTISNMFSGFERLDKQRIPGVDAGKEYLSSKLMESVYGLTYSEIKSFFGGKEYLSSKLIESVSSLSYSEIKTFPRRKEYLASKLIESVSGLSYSEIKSFFHGKEYLASKLTKSVSALSYSDLKSFFRGKEYLATRLIESISGLRSREFKTFLWGRAPEFPLFERRRGDRQVTPVNIKRIYELMEYFLRVNEMKFMGSFEGFPMPLPTGYRDKILPPGKTFSILRKEETKTDKYMRIRDTYPESSLIYYEGFRYAIPAVGLSILHLEPEFLLSKFITHFSSIERITSRLLRSSTEYISEYIHSELLELYKTEFVKAQQEFTEIEELLPSIGDGTPESRSLFEKRVLNIQKRLMGISPVGSFPGGFHPGMVDSLPPAARNLFEKRFLDFPKLLEVKRSFQESTSGLFLNPELLLSKFILHFSTMQNVALGIAGSSNEYISKYFEEELTEQYKELRVTGNKEIDLFFEKHETDIERVFDEIVSFSSMRKLFTGKEAFLSIIRSRIEEARRYWETGQRFYGFSVGGYQEEAKEIKTTEYRRIRDIHTDNAFYYEGIFNAVSYLGFSIFNVELEMLRTKFIDRFSAVRRITSGLVQSKTDYIMKYMEWELAELYRTVRIGGRDKLALFFQNRLPVERLALMNLIDSKVIADRRMGLGMLSTEDFYSTHKHWESIHSFHNTFLRMDNETLEKTGYGRFTDSYSRASFFYNEGFRNAISSLEFSLSAVEVGNAVSKFVDYYSSAHRAVSKLLKTGSDFILQSFETAVLWREISERERVRREFFQLKELREITTVDRGKHRETHIDKTVKKDTTDIQRIREFMHSSLVHEPGKSISTGLETFLNLFTIAPGDISGMREKLVGKIFGGTFDLFERERIRGKMIDLTFSHSLDRREMSRTRDNLIERIFTRSEGFTATSGSYFELPLYPVLRESAIRGLYRSSSFREFQAYLSDLFSFKVLELEKFKDSRTEFLLSKELSSISSEITRSVFQNLERIGSGSWGSNLYPGIPFLTLLSHRKDDFSTGSRMGFADTERLFGGAGLPIDRKTGEMKDSRYSKEKDEYDRLFSEETAASFTNLGTSLYFFLSRKDRQTEQTLDSFGHSLYRWMALIKKRESFITLDSVDFRHRYTVETRWEKFVQHLLEKQHHEELLKKSRYQENVFEEAFLTETKTGIPVSSRLDKSLLEAKYRGAFPVEGQYAKPSLKLFSISLPVESWKAIKQVQDKEEDFFTKYFGKTKQKLSSEFLQSESTGMELKKEKVFDLWTLAFGKPQELASEMFYYTPEMSVNYTETKERIEKEVEQQTRQIKSEIETRISSVSPGVNMGDMADNVYRLILDRIKKESRLRGY